jgi:hypothetical protein
LEWSQGDPTKEYGGWIASIEGSFEDLRRLLDMKTTLLSFSKGKYIEGI